MWGFERGEFWVVVVLLLALYSWVSVWTGFFVMATAKRIVNSGMEIPLSGLAIVYLWLLLGVWGDALYNAIIGTWEYKEFPKWLRGEFMYSHRIERLANHPVAWVGADWRQAKALPFARMLNVADEGHIDLAHSGAYDSVSQDGRSDDVQ